jgi:hypothetical protein
MRICRVAPRLLKAKVTMVGWTHLGWLLPLLQQETDHLLDRGFDSAVSFAQSLSQWAYITIGASVALLIKDFNRRPKSAIVRWSFLAFLPGWALLGWSIYKGVRVHGAYIAYLMNPRHDAQTAILYINADAACQVRALSWGLAVFAVWLIFYLVWWIRHRDESIGQ